MLHWITTTELVIINPNGTLSQWKIKRDTKNMYESAFHSNKNINNIIIYLLLHMVSVRNVPTNRNSTRNVASLVCAVVVEHTPPTSGHFQFSIKSYCMSTMLTSRLWPAVMAHCPLACIPYANVRMIWISECVFAWHSQCQFNLYIY